MRAISIKNQLISATPPIAKNSSIIPELFSMLNEHKTVPIILKLRQHNWEKPNNEPKRLD